MHEELKEQKRFLKLLSRHPKMKKVWDDRNGGFYANLAHLLLVTQYPYPAHIYMWEGTKLLSKLSAWIFINKHLHEFWTAYHDI
jgi:hypothetical protein